MRYSSSRLLVVMAIGPWLFALVVAVSFSCRHSPAVSQGRIKAPLVEGDIKDLSFEDPSWANAPETPIALGPQQIALPKLEKAGPRVLHVRALCNRVWVSFHLSWDDPTQDRLAAIGSFSDSVAIQFPSASTPLPEAAMGGPPGNARTVVIHQWKAVWQEMSEGRLKGIKTFYPDTWNDLYIFEQLREGSKEEMEKTYTTSVASGNPLAHTGAPVRDVVAQGFGSLEISPEQTSRGRGTWKQGRWSVVISRPLVRESSELATDRLQYAAFAVWDGSCGEVGARKMVSDWVPIEFVRTAAAEHRKGGAVKEREMGK
jgi:hypothetical protein